MISLKQDGNSILGEFIKLTGGGGIRKEAQAETEDDVAQLESDAIAAAANAAAAAAANAAATAKSARPVEVSESAEDFLVEQVSPASDPVAAAIDKEVECYAGRDMQIMTGLGKIAAGLRLKGEGFAADMVEATALSIGVDIKKEAAERGSVIGNLKKLAGDIDRDGDSFAGDMVRATISNIVSN
jgi:hypothetical protein